MSNIFIVIFATLSASFAIAYVLTFNRLTLMNKTFINLSISHQALQDFIKETQNNSKDYNDIHKENFIKFLSDSRDWAFTYIENVQTGIAKFIQDVGPTLTHFNEFGIVIDGAPHSDDMKKISKAYEELKILLPAEETMKEAKQ